MIKINLLPFRLARKKENIRRQVSVFFLLILFSTAVLYWGNSYWNVKIDALTAKNGQLKTELQAAMAAANEVDKIKKELDALEQKRKIIEELKANRKMPVILLEAMTRLVIEKRMWFTSFSEKDSAVTIKGIALDNKTVADFMGQLERSGLFSTVNLDILKQETFKNSLSLKAFDITCNKVLPQQTVESKANAS
ncbi:MAG: PilN domain-containing protein [Pseudomonadota bacterium]